VGGKPEFLLAIGEDKKKEAFWSDLAKKAFSGRYPQGLLQP